MEFCEKLDFLLNVTKTTNSMLARYICVDASHISRLRTGSRQPARNADYIKPMAAYFARHSAENNKYEVILTAIKASMEFASELDKPEELIFHWLSAEVKDGMKPIGQFLESLSQFSFRRTPFVNTTQNTRPSAQSKSATEVFYGPQGKREAVEAFLNDVLRLETPITLLLSSEEDLDWLTEKCEFMMRWSLLLQQVIMRGNKVKIIHHISRHLDEMLTAISEWLPIYMTGSVEPYYYPKTRDGFFQNTLFVAPGAAAVISSSVAGKTDGMANFLIRDKKAVEATARQIGNYFEFCKPLLYVFSANQADAYEKALAGFENTETVTVLRCDCLSCLTLPAEIIQRMSNETDDPAEKRLLLEHIRRLETFEEGLAKFQFHEIIKLPDLTASPLEYDRMPMSIFSAGLRIKYTPEILKQQIMRMIALLKKYQNYFVYLDSNSSPEKNIIYLKEDVGVIVTKLAPPQAVFALSESKMTAAFWDYLTGRLGKSFRNEDYKRQVIAKLEQVANTL